MLTKDAIAHFKTEAALARALGIRAQSVQDWGTVVPALRQLQLERITRGELRADGAVADPTQAASPPSDGDKAAA
jgi:transcriptional repressor of cell division inhibition gene dicB